MADDKQKIEVVKVDAEPVLVDKPIEAAGKPNTQSSNTDLVNSSKIHIPTTLKENFNSFQDVPREDAVDALYSSPSEVMASTKQKSTTVTDEEDDFDPNLELDSGLNAFLDQLNITRKQFYSFLVFFLVLILGVVVSFYFLFSFFSTGTEEVKVINAPVVEQVEVVKTEDPVEVKTEESEPSFISKVVDRVLNPFGGSKDETEPEKADVKPDTDSEEKSTSVDSVTDIGQTPASKLSSSAISATVKIGSAEIQEDRLSFYVRTYRKVRNLYNTDLFVYLSTVPDRNAGFQLFMTQFKGAFEESKIAYEDLRQEVAELSARVDKLKADAAEVENIFFANLDNLESEAIPNSLKAFQDISQKRDLAIAELKARQAIAERYEGALPLIEKKIIAIEANKDPFVKGVKVIDFPSVELDLVVNQR